MQRNAPLPKMTRTAPPIEQEELPVSGNSIQGALAEPIYRCYVCEEIPRNGRVRVINKRELLAICTKCDPDYVPPKLPSLMRTAPSVEIAPEEAVCCVCGKELINQRKLARKMEHLQTNSITDKDRERLEAEIRNSGWRNLGMGKFAHIRCLKKRRK